MDITSSTDFYHIELQLFGVGTLKRDLTASGAFWKSCRPASMRVSVSHR
jgi:hypothetical protein